MIKILNIKNMRRINFKELNVEMGIDEFETRDLRKEIGNAVHRGAMDVPMHDLARVIYYSEGPIDIPDKEYLEMMEIVKRSFAFLVYDSVGKCAENITGKEEEAIS